MDLEAEFEVLNSRVTTALSLLIYSKIKINWLETMKSYKNHLDNLDLEAKILYCSSIRFFLRDDLPGFGDHRDMFKKYIPTLAIDEIFEITAEVSAMAVEKISNFDRHFAANPNVHFDQILNILLPGEVNSAWMRDNTENDILFYSRPNVFKIFREMYSRGKSISLGLDSLSGETISEIVDLELFRELLLTTNSGH